MRKIRARYFCLFIFILAAAILPNDTEASGWAGKQVYGTAADGTQLHWVVYEPDGAGPWPAVLVIHAGGFRGGSPASGADVALDLANAGYLALDIEYRLAPPGALEGQTSDGRYPQQEDDVKMAVRAARANPLCNGQVGAVGGSAGGYHAAYVAVTGTPGDDQIDVGVSMSGAYDFSDFSPNPNLAEFTRDVTNYAGVAQTDTATLRGDSPAWLATKNVPPLFLINSEDDPMPFSQLGDMTSKLDSLGVKNYAKLTIPGADHAFDYWGTVKDQVLNFLADGFLGVPYSSATPTPAPLTGPAKLVNVSTRVHVGDGDQVMIGGFIVTGTENKDLVLRALGPSLANEGVTGVLANPVLGLYDSSGNLIVQNDNFAPLPDDLVALGLTPANPLESVVIASVPPGNYTAKVSGVNNATGVGLLEIYDLNPDASTLSNISTRGEVVSSSDPLIGGFILGGSAPGKVLVRALGPSLDALGVSDPVPDPTLELRNANGTLVHANDNWRSSQEAEIEATKIPPKNDLESAIVATVPPGQYTAIVRDSGSATGVALVEVYDLPND
jgi:acetyl esterase/lipase